MLSGDDGGGSPVVDEGSSKSARNLRVEVQVLTEAGEPAADTNLRLNNRQNNDPLTGQTGDDGRLVFVDSVGPPPCNNVELSVPEHGITESIGCHNGDKTVEATLEVPSAAVDHNTPTETSDEPTDGETSTRAPDAFGDDPPVVDEGSSDEARNLRVELAVLNESGDPAADTEVRLNNRENDDPPVGRTDANGRVTFVDSVGPSPCNDIVVLVPSLDVSEALGCHNGGKTIEAVVEP